MRSVCCLSVLTVCCCCCSNSFMVFSKAFCSSVLFTSFCVLLSSTARLKSENCSLMGFNRSSICVRLAFCSSSCLAASSLAAVFCMSFFSVSSFSSHRLSLSLRMFSARSRSCSRVLLARSKLSSACLSMLLAYSRSVSNCFFISSICRSYPTLVFLKSRKTKATATMMMRANTISIPWGFFLRG